MLSFHLSDCMPLNHFYTNPLQQHHQIIGRSGTGLEVLQRAEDGVIEAFRHKTLPVWGIQWHPERLTADCQTGTVDGLAVYRAFLSQAAL